MNLNNLYFVLRSSDLKVTCVVDQYFGGVPGYLCEAATPQQVSEACKADLSLKVVRS